jgi:hypothetical protein
MPTMRAPKTKKMSLLKTTRNRQVTAPPRLPISRPSPNALTQLRLLSPTKPLRKPFATPQARPCRTKSPSQAFISRMPSAPFGRKASRALDQAIEALRQIGIIDVAKAATKWMKEHPWETAAILIPLILHACTPAFLSIVGFGAGGIAAGMFR